MFEGSPVRNPEKTEPRVNIPSPPLSPSPPPALSPSSPFHPHHPTTPPPPLPVLPLPQASPFPSSSPFVLPCFCVSLSHSCTPPPFALFAHHISFCSCY
ncbi:unnamed protein product [Closterium sp. NIES-65]|nr:unnamed protein product [Closterium sp. NIES-65]